LSREKEMPFGKSLATVFVDRAIDVVLLVLLTFIGIFGLLYFYGLKEASLAFIFIGSAGIIAAMLAVFSKRLIKKLLTPLYKVMIPERFRDRLRDSFHDFYEGTKEIRKNRKGLAASFLFTLLLWLGNIIVFYIVGLSAGIPLNFMFFAFIMPIAFLAESLPISISGVGTREAVFVLLYPLASLSQEQAVAHAILILLHNLLIGSVGLLLWLRNRINLS
jgi:uncharacterized protein (TIRG00374 family)